MQSRRRRGGRDGSMAARWLDGGAGSTEPAQSPGTSVSISVSQARAVASAGMRQSPRGDSEPPASTFGALGRAERLNWLAKNRRQNTVSHFLISARAERSEERRVGTHGRTGVSMAIT